MIRQDDKLTQLRRPLDHYLRKAYLQKRNGYMLINTRDGKPERLHRLAWCAFYGNIPTGYEVNHINGQKWDNFLTNLEIMTKEEHTRHHASERVGIKRSGEALENIRTAARNRIITPEFRKKVGDMQRGRKQSPETIAKRSASIKRVWEIKHDKAR
jgi:ribosomal protein S19